MGALQRALAMNALAMTAGDSENSTTSHLELALVVGL